MKHWLFISLLFYALNINAQSYNYSLSGNPVNTTNWVMTGNTSVVNDAILLVPNNFNQTGSIYYGTPEMLALCSRFTVKFKFKISDHHSNGPADGFSFFYLNNPPNNLILGGGIGVPPNPEGLLLIFDTHDNNGNNDNPLISLRYFDGTANYSENNNTGALTPDVTSLNQIVDGNWHNCEIHYNNGDVKVFLDAVQIMNANINLNISGNFGFSASTGAQYSNHWLKDVEIVGDEGASVDLGPDTTVCDNASYTLNSGNNFPNQSYLWNTDDTTASITVNTSGAYYVTVASSCGNASDTVNITFNQSPAPPISIDTNLCGTTYGLPVRVPARDTGLTWAQTPNGTPTTEWPYISSNVPGVYHYYIQKRNADCPSDTAEITVSMKIAPDITALNDQTVCEDQRPVHLSVDTQNVSASLRWNTGDTTTSILAYAEGKYKVIATNACGIDSAQCVIAYKFCPDFCVWVPNAFTPNGDGMNDDFEPKVYCDLKAYKLSIYNRFGEMVYQTTNTRNKWNGNFKGKLCDVGTYFFSITAYQNDGKPFYMKGDLQLIR